MIASIVVCTYNRARLLDRLLKILAVQTIAMDQYEIIVVNDGSTDETAMVCRCFRSILPNMVTVPVKQNRGLTKARNIGIAAASADFILFVDDDCLPAKDWIEKTCAALRKHPIVAGAVAATRSSYLQLCHNIAEFHRFMPGRRRGPTFFIAGANMAFRRDVLRALKGFRESQIIAEDMDFVLRARRHRYPIHFEPDSLVVHHHDRDGLFEVFAYSTRNAGFTISLRKRYRHLLRTPFVLHSAVLLLLSAPLIALMTSLGIYLRNPSMARFVYTLPVVFGLKLAWCWGAARGLSAMKALEEQDA